MNAAKAYRRLKEVEETKLSNRLMLLRVRMSREQREVEWRRECGLTIGPTHRLA
jgi:hypothetical protein